jgi:excisionase family DNA binding protein
MPATAEEVGPLIVGHMVAAGCAMLVRFMAMERAFAKLGRTTATEVATLLKVADETVYTMGQKAEIPAFKVRGQWRFKQEDIDAWIEQQKSANRAGCDHAAFRC